jgi:sugar/nucleoside kinase (ribokinase family)
MATGSVLIAGHLCVDLTPGFDAEPQITPGTLVEVDPIDIRLGGCVANTGRSLAAMGVPVSVSAAIGDDHLASLVRELASDEAFTATEFFVAPGRATSYSVVVESPGRDRMFWHHTGANAGFDGREIVFGDAVILHVGYPSLLPAMRADNGAALVALFQRARAAGVGTSLDLAVAAPFPGHGRTWDRFFSAVLPHTDVISPSLDDLRSVAPAESGVWSSGDASQLAEDLVERGAAIALVTDGPRGMHLATAGIERLRSVAGTTLGSSDWADQRRQLSASPISAGGSTNGAGDAATAGLLAALVRGASPDEAIRSAASSASRRIESATPRVVRSHRSAASPASVPRGIHQ